MGTSCVAHDGVLDARSVLSLLENILGWVAGCFPDFGGTHCADAQPLGSTVLGLRWRKRADRAFGFLHDVFHVLLCLARDLCEPLCRSSIGCLFYVFRLFPGMSSECSCLLSNTVSAVEYILLILFSVMADVPCHVALSLC